MVGFFFVVGSGGGEMDVDVRAACRAQGRAAAGSQGFHLSSQKAHLHCQARARVSDQGQGSLICHQGSTTTMKRTRPVQVQVPKSGTDTGTCTGTPSVRDVSLI